MDVHLEAVMEGILQSKEKSALPMFSMRQRLNRKHQSLQLLLSIYKDLSSGSSYSQQVDGAVYQMHYCAKHFLVLRFVYLALQSNAHIRF